MALDAEFSSLPGYRLEDFDTVCPKTGEQCEVQQLLVSRYLGNAGLEAVDLGLSMTDRVRLQAKLAEYKVRALTVNYDGFDPSSEDSFCPTRKSMDLSLTRATAVTGFRGLRKIIRKRT